MADRWATYEEAGQQFGLSADAMRKRARRLGWRVQAGNDGKARILVPKGADISLDGRSGRPPGRPGNRVDVRVDDRLDGLLVELRRRDEAAENRAERAEDERDSLATEIIKERERRARAEGEATVLQQVVVRQDLQIQQVTGRAERAEGEAGALRQALAREVRQLEQTAEALKAAETQRDAAQSARSAVAAELAAWASSGPLARAWRAILYRRRP